jgi:predicted nucleic acid-binding protein
MVHAELAIDTARPGAKVLAEAFAAEWITVKPVVDVHAVSSISRLVDAGEAEAIVLAEQETALFLLIDDARGRRIARERGIPVVGVAGVLLSAKSRGALAEVRPMLDALSQVGYRLSPRLVTAVLERAGE